ncbi:hypothetical protein COCC4DRAFT_140978, partial [Bipolaris maydis ATCC 48331]
KKKYKTYNSGDSPVVTRLTTSPPVESLTCGEQTRSSGRMWKNAENLKFRDSVPRAQKGNEWSKRLLIHTKRSRIDGDEHKVVYCARDKGRRIVVADLVLFIRNTWTVSDARTEC